MIDRGGALSSAREPRDTDQEVKAPPLEARAAVATAATVRPVNPAAVTDFF